LVTCFGNLLSPCLNFGGGIEALVVTSPGVAQHVGDCCLVLARVWGSGSLLPGPVPCCSVLAFAPATDAWQRNGAEGTWQMLFRCC